MTGNPNIVAEVTISNTGGTTSSSTYKLTLVEGLTLEENPRTSKVEDDQTIQDGFDNNFSFRTYDLSILDDARVQYGATIPGTKARLKIVGASGASSKEMDGLRLSGKKVFDGNRDAAEIIATRRSADSIISLT